MSTVDPRDWAAPRPSGLRRYVPILTWLPAYDRGWLRFDVIAGATIWGLLVPEMIAYAGLAGLPPQAGLYTLLVTLAAYAVFGTSRHVVVGGHLGRGGAARVRRWPTSARRARRSTRAAARRSCSSAAACSCSRASCGSGSSPSSCRAR